MATVTLEIFVFDLKMWRRTNVLTQEEAGEVLGITRKAYNKMERGKTKTSKRTEMACLFYAKNKKLYKKCGLDKR